MAKKATHRGNIEIKGKVCISVFIFSNQSFLQFKVGLNRLTGLAEKLSWLREALPGVEDEEGKVGDFLSEHVLLPFFQVTCAGVLLLVQGFLTRFDDEVAQIKLKQSIGGNQKNRRLQHSARMDAIELTTKTELSDFNGCGLELPDFFDQKTLEYFRGWEGEVRYVQNIKLKRFRKSDLEAGVYDVSESGQEPEAMDT